MDTIIKIEDVSPPGSKRIHIAEAENWHYRVGVDWAEKNNPEVGDKIGVDEAGIVLWKTE
jgi:hypothetical protein